MMKYLERHTKIDLSYLAHSVSWSLVGQLASSLSAFALSLVISRYVPLEVYGNYKYVISMVGLLGAFSLTGIGTALLQSVARGYDGALIESFTASIRWSVAVFLGALALGAYYLLLGNSALGIGFLLGGCFSPFISATNLYSSYLAGKQDFRRQAIYGGIVNSAVPSLALIVTALIAPRPIPIIAAYLISNLLANFYGYWQTVRLYRPILDSRDSEMQKYAKHLSVIGILTTIANNIDQVLLFHYTSAVELAIYNFATGLVDQSKGPLKTLDSMFQARFATRTESEISGTMHNKYFWIFIASIVAIAVYIPLAPLIYKILFPAYQVAVPYSQVYALSLAAFALMPTTSYLVAKKHLKKQYLNTIFGSLLQVAIMAAGVIGWGLWGLIIARVITRFSGSILTYYLYRHP